jgi:diaminopimelate epimerase
MVYYNSDGNESTMRKWWKMPGCFCSFLDIFEEKCTFNAIDGLHEAEIKRYRKTKND